MLLVHHREVLAGLSGRLRRSEHKETSRVKRVLEHGQHVLLKHGVEIDQEIAATDQVEPGEGRVPSDVVAGENALVPDGFGDLVALFDSGKEAPQPGRAGIGGNTFHIHARAGPLDRRLADVRAENLNGIGHPLLGQEFEQGNGDGIDLLARRAARHPDPDRRPVFALGGDGRKDFFF